MARRKKIRAGVRVTYKPNDVHLLPKKQHIKIEEWFDQVPVLTFNCGRYDLKIIKGHFAERLPDRALKVKVARKGNSKMFMLTPGFRFLDVINYLRPGTSYEGGESLWVHRREIVVRHPRQARLPRGAGLLVVVLTPSHSPKEFQACKGLFKEKGKRTFRDWLRHYNNLNVAPGLEGLGKMKIFFTVRRESTTLRMLSAFLE